MLDDTNFCSQCRAADSGLWCRDLTEGSGSAVVERIMQDFIVCNIGEASTRIHFPFSHHTYQVSEAA